MEIVSRLRLVFEPSAGNIDSPIPSLKRLSLSLEEINAKIAKIDKITGGEGGGVKSQNGQCDVC